MRTLSIIIFCFLFVTVNAQRKYAIKNRYAKGSIQFANGEILDCEIAFPILNRSLSLGPTLRSKNKIKVKDMLGKKQSIEIDEINTIVFEGDDGFYSMKVMHSLSLRRKGKIKQSRHKAWFIVDEGCEEIQGYIRADKFDLDKTGRPYAMYEGNLGQYLLQRKSEDLPTVIGPAISYRGISSNSWRKGRLAALTQYMKGDEDVESFLEDKKGLTAEELVEYIIERCK